jgi:phthalate 4,5-dioxygenase oxygenase subunit
VLTLEENEALSRVGPGTLMGELLRRCWTPAMLSSEVAEPGGPPVRVRLLGERLVAFRGDDGHVGLLQENCPHRGASLYFGRNEDCSLRCVYHGWAFDTQGRCVDMPSEPRPFTDRIRARAYPTHEWGGVIWAWLGPKEAMTPFRPLGPAGSDEPFLALKQESTCNWIQSMEGNIDTAHISHLHQFDGVDDLPDDGTDEPGYPSAAMSWRFWRFDRAPRLEVEETPYGFRYAGIRKTPKGHTHVRISAWALPYFTWVASIPFGLGIHAVVPADDESCWRYFMAPRTRPNPRGHGKGANVFSVAPFSTPALSGAGGVQGRPYTAENDYGIDRMAQRGLSFTGIPDFGSQDLMATETQGAIRDRTDEHLGTTDVAIIRMRTLLLAAARGLAQGIVPAALDPGLDLRSIRSAEKVLAPGEDWRVLGTDADPLVQEALGLGAPVAAP